MIDAQAQRHLQSIKGHIDDLAKSLKEAYDLGYVVNFNIDPSSGRVTSFEVKEQKAVDINEILGKMGKTN